MNTIYKYNCQMPYGLHDMQIDKIKLVNRNLKLYFQNGYIKLQEPLKQVEGNIIIKNIDLDFCFVYFLSENSALGNFTGKKLYLVDFLKEYKHFTFEVVDELYFHNQIRYSGYLNLPNKVSQIQLDISIYYTGNIVYETEI